MTETASPTDRLAAAIRELPERLRQVVEGYFVEQRPTTELAVEQGVSEPQLARLCAEALVALRDAMAPGPRRPACRRHRALSARAPRPCVGHRGRQLQRHE